ncbi:MAG: DUF7281 domain-containing protein [Methylobacter sp.]
MYEWIGGLVRDKPEQTSSRPVSPTGRQVLADYGCGYISNNKLNFSAEHKRRLRQQVKDEMGLDPFTDRLPDDRLEMSEYHANEKLAAEPASNDQLLLNSADGIVRINNAQIQLHPESVKTAGLLCMNAGINSVEHRTIVVVENLDIMPLCHSWQLPLSEPDALWIYRGDHKSGAKAKACRDFLQRFGKDKTVVVFSDMDPKGLEIALTLPFANFWLGPCENSRQALLNSNHANDAGFDIQSKAVGYLLRQLNSNVLSEPFKRLISSLRDQRSSFRQQHTYSRNVTLELVPIWAEDHC